MLSSALRSSPTVPDMTNRLFWRASLGIRASSQFIVHASRTAPSAMSVGANQKLTLRRSHRYRALALRSARVLMCRLWIWNATVSSSASLPKSSGEICRTPHLSSSDPAPRSTLYRNRGLHAARIAAA